MILDVILVLLLLGAIGGFGYGWRGGGLPPASPLGILLVVVIILLLAGLVVPHVWAPYGPVRP